MQGLETSLASTKNPLFKIKAAFYLHLLVFLIISSDENKLARASKDIYCTIGCIGNVL